MRIHYIDEEVIVHPIDGMQLSEGYIHEDDSEHFRGCLPGIAPLVTGTFEETLHGLEKRAKAYYGDDVVVDVTPHADAV